MRKNYDFSKAEKNPFYKKIKGKKIRTDEEVSFELKDLIKLEKNSKSKKKLSETIIDLEKRLKTLEAKIK